MKSRIPYRIIKEAVRIIYPKIKLQGEENIPQGPSIIVGNHSKANGPISAELYVPGTHYTWCIGQMMNAKEVPDYSYVDFSWNRKPILVRWLYRIASYIIAPLAEYIFTQANTIPVYKDSRIINTFRETVTKLEENAKVVIFPEHAVDYNGILCEFQKNFIDVAKMYYSKTGKCVCFVPMYLAPNLKTMFFGKPIYYDPEIPIKVQRDIIVDYLMTQITEIAESQPEHVVVPYRNIPKKDYPLNHKTNF